MNMAFLSHVFISVFVVQKSLSSEKGKKWIKQTRYGRKKQKPNGTRSGKEKNE
jgi:hypothetical protein